MKTKFVFGIIGLAAGSLLAADLKEELTSATKQLADKDNYSWKSTMEFGNFSGNTDGKIDKDGLVAMTMTFGDNTREAFLKDGKGAVKLPDEGWKSLNELESSSGEGRGRQFLVRRLKNFKAPAQQAADLITKVADLKKDGEIYSGDLTEAGAKELLTFGRGRGGAAAEAKNAKASVKLWVKDGMLSKYEIKQQGTVSFGGDERDIDGTTTVEIKDVGKTKVDVPEDAKKKLS
jgi:hypothetical protein